MKDDSDSGEPGRRKEWGPMMVSALIVSVIGLVGTIFGLITALGQSGKENYVSELGRWFGDASPAMVLTAGGLFVSAVGLILAFVSVLVLQRNINEKSPENS